MNINGAVHRFGHCPDDYLTNVITRRGVDFINASAKSHKPFFLESRRSRPTTVRAGPPRRQEVSRAHGAAPGQFDALPTDAPRVARGSPAAQPGEDRPDRPRLPSARPGRAVDRPHDRRGRDGRSKRTGSPGHLHRVHLRQRSAHRRVPADARQVDRLRHRYPRSARRRRSGRARRRGRRRRSPRTSTSPSTFASIASTHVSSEGRSLLALLHGKDEPDWRNAALIEHHGPAVGPGNPDAQNPISGNPPSYEAMRTPRFLYVEYDNGEHEYYALDSDPTSSTTSRGRSRRTGYRSCIPSSPRSRSCHDTDACWSAGHVSP